ncbi:hypothetical protein Vafri_20338 [Volvox africanus]|uniref:AAA+ ATPase domain-containing protein n=1 Tax=Volvox africanus TaxID=51714 RepID=A0A8J4BQN7_9CHLO|nr:hypothetical protein Vafri_20338 [Volvox africanus]
MGCGASQAAPRTAEPKAPEKAPETGGMSSGGPGAAPPSSPPLAKPSTPTKPPTAPPSAPSRKVTEVASLKESSSTSSPALNAPSKSPSVASSRASSARREQEAAAAAKAMADVQAAQDSKAAKEAEEARAARLAQLAAEAQAARDEATAAAEAQAAAAAAAAAAEAAAAEAARPIPVARDSPLIDVIRGEAFDIRDKVKDSLPSMPFPVSAAAREVVTLANQSANCFANADNLSALRQRAVAGLALLHVYGDLLRDAPPSPAAAAAAAAATGGSTAMPGGSAAGMGLHAVTSTFRDLVAAMSAFARPYCGRGCVVHMLAADAAAEKAAFARLVSELTTLADDLMNRARNSRGWSGVPQSLSGRADDALLVLRLGPSYTDHLTKLHGAVKSGGGLDTVCSSPEAFLDSALVIQELSLGSKISKDLAVSLLTAHADRGPARLLQQPELRLLWRTSFGSEAEVSWSAWWEAFPAGIAKLPGLGMGPLAQKLGAMLADDFSKAAFQRHVMAASNVIPVAGRGLESEAGISAYALAAAFGAPLTDAAEAGFDDLAGEVTAALASASVPIDGPYQLPPLPPLHVPREELAEKVAAALQGGAGGADGGKCRAVCLVAPPGLGKSTLAVEAAWRLVRAGGARGGVVWVDLAGARTWHDVEARIMIALGLIKDNADGRPRIVSTLRACCSGSRPLLLVVDTIDNALRQPGAADGLWGLLGQVVEGCPGVRLLLASAAPVSLGDGADVTTVEVPPLAPTAAAKLACLVCPDLETSPGEGSRVALAGRCLPLAVRLMCGLRAEGRLSTRDIEALGTNSARPHASSPLSSAGFAEITVGVIAGCLTALPTAHQVAVLQLSALPPAGAGPETTMAALNAYSPAAAVGGRAVLAALQRQGLAGISALPGRRTQTVMHSLVRAVVVSALAPALDLNVRPQAEDRVATALLAAMATWGRTYGSREGGSSVLAAARAAQPEMAELLALLTRVTPRVSTSGGPPPILSGEVASAELAAAAAGQRLPLETIVTAAKGFNGDVAELLHGLGALPALEAVCEALSAPAVGLVANRAYKVEMANVYRVHALALIAQGKFEEAQAHGNMCIHLRSEAARKNPNSPAIASANMCLAASYAGMRLFPDAEELLRQAVDICLAAMGESSSHTAWALGALAASLEAQPTKAYEAEGFYRRALEARRTVQGHHHPRTIEATLALASCVRAAGRYEEAKQLYETATAAALRVFGEFHAATAIALSGAATCTDGVVAAAATEAAGGDVAAAAKAQEAQHDRAAAVMAALALETADAASGAYGRGRNYTLQGRHKEAEVQYRRAVDLCGKTLPRDAQGREQAATITALLALGECLMEVGKPAEAQVVLERALNAKVRVLGTQAHPEAAAIARLLAAAAMATRRYAIAEPLCRQALAMAQHGVGMESKEAAAAMSEYARCMVLQGRHPAAEPLLRQALELRMKSDGEAAAATAAARVALGDCLAAQQDAAGAEPHYRKAYEMLMAAGGTREAALEAAAAAHGLGLALLTQSKAAEAEGVLKEALEARRKHLGPEHKDTGSTLSALATALGDRGRYSEAEALFRADLEAAEKTLGPRHPNTATAMSALAGCLQAQGRLPEAEPLFMTSRNICTTQLGPDHPNTLTVTANLAACLAAQGRHAEAQPLYEAELEATKRVQGENHPDVATSLNHLATCLQALGQLDDAERAARQAVSLFLTALGDGHPNSALATNTLGLVLLAQGKASEAVTLLEAAMTTCDTRLGPQHAWTIATKKNLETAKAAAGSK